MSPCVSTEGTDAAKRGATCRHTPAPQAAGTIQLECRVTPGQQRAKGPEGRMGPWTRTRRHCCAGHEGRAVAAMPRPAGHTRKEVEGREPSHTTLLPPGNNHTQTEKRTLTMGNRKQPVQQDKLCPQNSHVKVRTSSTSEWDYVETGMLRAHVHRGTT